MMKPEKQLSDALQLICLIRPLLFTLCICLLAFSSHVFAEPCSGKSKDIVKVSGRVVVFYAISQMQLDLLSQDDREAYTELLSDFYEYAGRLGRYLDKQGIKHILTGSRFIKVKAGKKTYCYDKTKFEEEVGVILSDGKKQPKVVHGLFTDFEISPVVDEYYSLKLDHSSSGPSPTPKATPPKSNTTP